MNRGADYEEAKWRVKISHFTEKGIDFKGVIHVGTNDGYEIQWYRKMGLKVLGFEPLKSAYAKCFVQYGQDDNVILSNCGIGLINTQNAKLHETHNPKDENDTGGSSFLKEIVHQDHIQIRDARVEMITMKKWLETANCWKSAFHDFNIEDYDCLVIDVEGMELEVLRSFAEADILCNFTGLNVECSRQSWYEGGTPAQEVIDYLAKQGFAQDSPIDEHDDIMFINKITQ